LLPDELELMSLVDIASYAPGGQTVVAIPPRCAQLETERSIERSVMLSPVQTTVGGRREVA